MAKLKTAIVGCGAVTEIHYLPASIHSKQVEVTLLVDKCVRRARMLADRYGVPAVTDNYRNIVDKVDGAIVALPNYLHAPVTIDLLQHGIHVLVEKPMAIKTSECDQMIEAANGGVVLAVGLVFRFFVSSLFVKQMLEKGFLGDITGFDLRQGVISKWPAVSDFFIRKDSAGGGVLIDFGVHVLDLLLWWLGDYESFEYYDDAMGGVEADCELYLRLKCGASGVVELSRTRNLRNTCIIHGERGTLEIGIWNPDPLVRLRINNQDVVLTGRVAQRNVIDRTWEGVFLRQLDDFREAALYNREPFISGAEGKRAVQLIEACYASRKLLKKPWM